MDWAEYVSDSEESAGEQVNEPESQAVREPAAAPAVENTRKSDLRDSLPRTQAAPAPRAPAAQAPRAPAAQAPRAPAAPTAGSQWTSRLPLNPDDRRGGYGDRRGGFDNNRRSGYGDRRGGHDDRRGGYDDRRGGHDDRRGGYDDRRGGYDDRRGGYDDRRGGYGDRRRDGDRPRRGGSFDRGPSGDARPKIEDAPVPEVNKWAQNSLVPPPRSPKLAAQENPAGHVRQGGLRNPRPKLVVQKPVVKDEGVIASLQEKGFGFIKSCSEDRDFFFSFRDAENQANDLAVGDEVQFEVVKSTRGKGDYNAVRVVKVAPGTVQWDDVTETVLTGVVIKEAKRPRDDRRRLSSHFARSDPERTGKIQVVVDDATRAAAQDGDSKLPSAKAATFSFGTNDMDGADKAPAGGGKKKSARLGDVCTFRVATFKRSQSKHAAHVVVTKTAAEQRREYIAAHMDDATLMQGKVVDVTGRKGSIAPLGDRTSELVFDTSIASSKGGKANPFRVDDEVEFKVLDVPVSGNETQECVFEVKKLKQGSLKLTETVAEGAVGYIVKPLAYPRPPRANPRMGGSRVAASKGKGTGGVVELAEPSILKDAVSEPKSVPKGGMKTIITRKKTKENELMFTSDDVKHTEWSWLGRGFPAPFAEGDQVTFDVVRSTIGKVRDAKVENMRMQQPFARGYVQSAMREVGVVSQMRDGFGQIKRAGLHQEIFFHFSSVFYTPDPVAASGGARANRRGKKDGGKSRAESLKGASSSDRVATPPIAEGCEVSYDVEVDNSSRTEQNRLVANRVCILPRGTVKKRANPSLASKVHGVVTAAPSSRGGGRPNQSTLGTIEFKGDVLHDTLQQMYPLIHAHLLDLREDKTRTFVELASENWSVLKLAYLARVCEDFNFSRERTVEADGPDVFMIRKNQTSNGSKKDKKRRKASDKPVAVATSAEDPPPASFLGEKLDGKTTLLARYAPDGVDSIRTTVEPGDEVEFELFVKNRKSETFGARGIKITKKKPAPEKKKDYGIVAYFSRYEKMGVIECISRQERLAFSTMQEGPPSSKKGGGGKRKKSASTAGERDSAPSPIAVAVGDEVEFSVPDSGNSKRRDSGERGEMRLASGILRLEPGALESKFGTGHRFEELPDYTGRYSGVVVAENLEPGADSSRGSSSRGGRGGSSLWSKRRGGGPKPRFLGKIDVSNVELHPLLNMSAKSRKERKGGGRTSTENDTTTAKEIDERKVDASGAQIADTVGDAGEAPPEESTATTSDEAGKDLGDDATAIDQSMKAATLAEPKSKVDDSAVAEILPMNTIAFRSLDISLLDNAEHWTPRIGDVVDFSIGKDNLLGGKPLVAHSLVRLSQGGVYDKGVVEAIKEESRTGLIKSYEHRTRMIRFELADALPTNPSMLNPGDEVRYLLVGAKPLRTKGEDPVKMLNMKAVNVEFIKAAPSFNHNRQRVNQALLQARMGGSEFAKGGMVLARVAKAPDGTRGFQLERTGYEKAGAPTLVPTPNPFVEPFVLASLQSSETSDLKPSPVAAPFVPKPSPMAAPYVPKPSPAAAPFLPTQEQ